MTELAYVSAVELARKIKSKQLSPVEVVDAFLSRIESVNPKINAFCTVVPELARKEAKKAEEALMRGDALGPLHGVPIAIKDLTPTAGIRTTFGSKLYADYVPEEDALFVKRVKKAGAIILGKTNTPEFGHKGTTDNLIFGTSKNPWNVAMTPGGSSGGSAAAVAAGLVPFAEGSDGGGSIRIPASLCGIFGFKPTYGRIPFDGKPQNMFSSQNPFLHYGPLSRTVEDGALLFSVMAGPDPGDPYCLPDTGEDYLAEMHGDVKTLRVAYSPNLGLYEIDTRVQRAMEQAVERLRGLGIAVDTVSLDFGPKERIQKGFATLWFTQIASGYSALLPEKKDLFCQDVVTMMEIGKRISALEYKEVEIVRTEIWREMQRLFENYDLLICPTLAVPAFPHELKGPKEINGVKVNPNTDWMLTGLFNMTGHPAASVPIGFTDDGLPIGMQVVGRRLEDSMVLRLSYAYEQAYPWTGRKPNI